MSIIDRIVQENDVENLIEDFNIITKIYLNKKNIKLLRLKISKFYNLGYKLFI